MGTLNSRIKLFIILFLLASVGILSLLGADIPLDPETEAILRQHFTDTQIKWLLLVNPFIMTLAGLVAGLSLYKTMGFQLPLLEKIAGIRKEPVPWKKILTSGLIGGLLAAVLLTAVNQIFEPAIPASFKASQPTLPLYVRMLYGGLTEEIAMRFGLMTFMAWVIYKITRRRSAGTYMAAIVLSALLFALAHFPAAFQWIDNPSPEFLAYILLGNMAGGIIFGWLYWKYGLESAILAHMTAHFLLWLMGTGV